MTGPATRTVTHPGPDGTLWHFPLPRIVHLSASLRRSGYTCDIALGERPEHREPCPSRGAPWHGVRCDRCRGTGVWVTAAAPAVLTVRWSGDGVRGCLRLVACEPTVAGTHGTIVDHLPVAGLATRPLPKRPVSEATRAVSLPGLRKALALAHGIGWRAPVLPEDEWQAREAEAARVLGADFARVTEAA